EGGTLGVQERQAGLDAPQVRQVGWRHPWDGGHHPLPASGARVSMPHPYALALPIPRTSARRSASESSTARTPSKVAVLMFTRCFSFLVNRSQDRSWTTTFKSPSLFSAMVKPCPADRSSNHLSC